jgi:hypothetical protein
VTRSRGFGIASGILAALIALGVLLNSPTTDPLDYLPFVIAAVVLVLPLGILGLVFGCLALLRARRAGVSKTDAVVAIALSGLGAAIGLGIRLWAETF